MQYKLQDLINLQKLRIFVNMVYKLVGIPILLSDAFGNPIVSSTENNTCDAIENENTNNDFFYGSDNKQAFPLSTSDKEFNIYICKNNIISISVPIILNGYHIGNIGCSYLLQNGCNLNEFKNITEQCELNANELLHLLSALPIETVEKIQSSINHLLQSSKLLAYTANSLKDNLELQEKLFLYEQKYKLITDGSNDVIWEWDIKNNKFFISSKWEDVIGEVLPKKYNFFYELVRFVHPDDIEKVNSALKEHLEGNTGYFECEYRVITTAGYIKWIFQKGKLLKDSSGNHILMSGSIADITSKKIYQQEINYLAYHDVLTNLPNRMYFSKKLNEVFNKFCIGKLQVAIFFIGIDDFKKKNDIYDHDIGDKLLFMFANLLQSNINENEIISHFSGDEFLLALVNYKNIKEVKKRAKELITLTDTSFQVNDDIIRVTSSIGVALYNSDENDKDVNNTIKNSAIALNKAKSLGKQRYFLFSETLSEETTKERLIEISLNKAILNGEFILYYQPQIDIFARKVYGVEALIRWNHPELGLLSPAHFIDITEKNGLITKIDKFVLSEACSKLSELCKYGYHDISMSINLSEKQFEDIHFVDYMKNLLSKYEIKTKNLCLEITERMLLSSNKTVLQTLNGLRELGLKIFIDDFGTKYSSLSYLNSFPVDGIKIDKSFIDEICDSPKELIITKNIITLAGELNIEVIAEGVEKEDQLNCLNDIKCNIIQGYLFSKPLPCSELVNYLSCFTVN